MSKIGVLLVDDHSIMRAALRLVLGHEQDMEVVGEASDGAGALVALRALRPDVALVDLVLPGLSGIALIERIRKEHSRTRTIALTVQHGFTHAHAVMAAGGSGYVVKDAELSVILAAIRAVHQGRTFIELGQPQGYADDLFRIPGDGDHLSAREREVLRLLARGHTNREIGERLHLSVKTVETYRHRLYQKLGLHSRADLVHFSLEQGWLGRNCEYEEPA